MPTSDRAPAEVPPSPRRRRWPMRTLPAKPASSETDAGAPGGAPPRRDTRAGVPRLAPARSETMGRGSRRDTPAPGNDGRGPRSEPRCVGNRRRRSPREGPRLVGDSRQERRETSSIGNRRTRSQPGAHASGSCGRDPRADTVRGGSCARRSLVTRRPPDPTRSWNALDLPLRRSMQALHEEIPILGHKGDECGP